MKRRLSHRLFLAACVATGILGSGATYAKPPARATAKAEKVSKVSKASKPSKLSKAPARKATGVRRSDSNSDTPNPQPPVDLPDPVPDDFNPGGKAPLSLGVVNTPIDKEAGLFGNRGKVAPTSVRAEARAVAVEATTRPVSATDADTSRAATDAQRAVHAANVQIAQDDLPKPVVTASR